VCRPQGGDPSGSSSIEVPAIAVFVGLKKAKDAIKDPSSSSSSSFSSFSSFSSSSSGFPYSDVTRVPVTDGELRVGWRIFGSDA
jgi:hypothetical protein